MNRQRGSKVLVDVKFRHFFYLSNLFSILRFFLLIPIHYFLARRGAFANSMAMATIFAAGLTDFLDGFFARRLNQKTDLGRILDPLADKVIIAGGFFGLVIHRDFPVVLLMFLLYRDLIILIGGLILTRKFGFVTESNIYGKANTVIVSSTAFLFIVLPQWWFTIGLIFLSYFAVLISGLSYLFTGFRLLRPSRFVRIIILVLLTVPPVLFFCLLNNHII
jgi:CDP-diacylglycerol--glycerol-3-phosphate 3-phosphatidyltransferase